MLVAGLIVQSMQARLQAALGSDIPVLLPEQIEAPKQGRTPGGTGGIPAYLATHPHGYVQIETPQAITSDGLIGTFWVAVASLHGDLEDCAALAGLVRRALTGTPQQPGPHREVMPAAPTLLQVGAWIHRPTYEALTLDGVNAAQE